MFDVQAEESKAIASLALNNAVFAVLRTLLSPTPKY